MAADETTEVVERFPDPDYVVYLWRLEQALALGLSIRDSEQFADSDADLGQLRALIARRCDPHLACEIVS